MGGVFPKNSLSRPLPEPLLHRKHFTGGHRLAPIPAMIRKTNVLQNGEAGLSDITDRHRSTPDNMMAARENGVSSGWPRASFARGDRPWEGDFCLSCDKKAGGPRNPLIFGDLAPPLLLK